VGGEFVVAAPEVLHERVAGDDDGGCSVGAQPAHRPQPALELGMIGYDPVVLEAFDMMPRGRDQLVEDRRVTAAASVTTSVGTTLRVANACWKNRRAAWPSRLAETSTSMTCPY
jgi:hypothetical protein